jgi:outer membrane protein assembly factor BamC
MQRQLFVTAVTAAVLSGCSWLGGDSSSVDYKSAGSLPPLEVPPDLTAPQRDNRYAIPEAPTRSSATLSGYEAERRDPARGVRPAAAPAPGGPVVLPVIENVRLERLGQQRWLVVQEPPEKVWPVVKAFWQESGFLIKVEVPEAGVMETDWAESRARIQEGAVRDFLGKIFDYFHSTAERDKYRTRLDRTPDGGTEIYISHRGMQELYTTREPTSSTPGATAWQPRPPDPELEAEYLRRLMVKLGTPGERAKELTAASTEQPNQRAEIVKANDGTQRLQVYEPFDRAWRRVGLALDRVGFTVEDRDRQKGLYFVRYADPESEATQKERGLLARWFSSDSKVKAEQFRVQVSSETSGSQVQVVGKDGSAESSKTAQRILALLHEQLK